MQVKRPCSSRHTLLIDAMRGCCSVQVGNVFLMKWLLTMALPLIFALIMATVGAAVMLYHVIARAKGMPLLQQHPEW